MNRNSLAQLVALISLFVFVAAESAQGQGSRGRGGPPGGNSSRGGSSNNARHDSSATVSPIAPGESGIAWYATWEIASKEAKRSNRPILYMAATAQCGGVPGVF